MRTTLPSGTPVEIVRTPGAQRGLVICPDIAGLRPLFETMAARLAQEHGWSVAVPEPYPGQGDVGVPDRIEQMASYDAQRQLTDARSAADLLGVAAVGLIGFCMGGTCAIRAAAEDRFDRLVAFYGMARLPESWLARGATQPIDVLRATPGAAAKLLVLSGTADSFVPVDQLDDLETAGAHVVRYEGAGHAFAHDPDAPWHRADNAADAWDRAVAFLS